MLMAETANIKLHDFWYGCDQSKVLFKYYLPRAGWDALPEYSIKVYTENGWE